MSHRPSVRDDGPQWRSWRRSPVTLMMTVPSDAHDDGHPVTLMTTVPCGAHDDGPPVTLTTSTVTLMTTVPIDAYDDGPQVTLMKTVPQWRWRRPQWRSWRRSPSDAHDDGPQWRLDTMTWPGTNYLGYCLASATSSMSPDSWRYKTV